MSDTRRTMHFGYRNPKMTAKHQSNASGYHFSRKAKHRFINGEGIIRNSKHNLEKKIEQLKLNEEMDID